MNVIKKCSILFAFFLSICAAVVEAEVRDTYVFLAGDSTMSEKELKDYPETGWGTPFSWFFNDTITVENLAKNGRSTRTFISEGRWENLTSSLKTGDFVFIQFGHNDASKHKKDRYTSPAEYEKNLTQMISDVETEGANPILLSSVVRRHFDDTGKLKKTHPYSDIVKKVAKKTGVTFLDMEKITHDYFQAMGDEQSALRFMHIEPNLNPNYPNGVRDNTHFNPLGALEVAQLVLSELKKIKHPLASRLRDVDPKHLKLSY